MSGQGRELTRAQRIVLGAAFVPMVATGVAGGYGTYTNIAAAYGSGTAVGAVAAGEGATAVLALLLLGLTMLGQSSPLAIRAGLWALPAAASVMAATAATTPGEMVIYALTPMGMTASAEGAAFLARRIVVHRDGRDAEAERRAAAVVQALAYHRARSAHHPDDKIRQKSELKSWKLARKVGTGDYTLAGRLLEVQRQRVTDGADAALTAMFGTPTKSAPPVGSVGPVVEVDLERPTQPTTVGNAEETAQIYTERSTSEQAAPALEPAPDTPDRDGPEESTPADQSADEGPTGRAVVRAVAAEQRPRRRATGRVPDAARSPRPRRTRDGLLAEARQLTGSWRSEELTADRIRQAVRTSADNGRWLRDTLRAERSEAAA
ncbi:conjugal transfer protein [Streptomyces fradiae]|uniref:conjugal transfer protein n=1 Tax=Streptomyces fradiae TaxID=1906 RepID=UPI0035BE1652